MSDNKELHYRSNGMRHLKAGILWAITIIGIPVAAVYWAVASVEFALAALHWTVGVLRFLF